MHRECQEHFPRHLFQRKLLISDPGMPHGTCVTHVPWCMSGSLTHGGGENVPGIPGACATRSFTYLARGPLAVSALAPASMTTAVTAVITFTMKADWNMLATAGSLNFQVQMWGENLPFFIQGLWYCTEGYMLTLRRPPIYSTHLKEQLVLHSSTISGGLSSRSHLRSNTGR